MSEEKNPLWKDIKSYPRRVTSWFRRGRIGWTWLIGITAASLLTLLFLCTFEADHVRFLGLMLQILGFLTIALKLSQITHASGKPVFYKRIAEYFRELPKLRTKTYPLRANAIEIGAAIASGRATVHASADATVEERLKSLEAKIKMLDGEISRLQTKQRESESALRSKIEEERKARNDQVSRVENLINSLVVDGIHIEWVGVFLFLVGITLGTIPEEVRDFVSADICRNWSALFSPQKSET